MKTTFSVLVFTFLLFTDQITKIASDFFSDGSNFINPICNSNIAWSVPVKPAFFYPLWFAIIFLLIKYFSQAKNKFDKLSLTLILSGAISNMIDRATHGCVIDFIDLKIWPASIATRSIAGWPVFNLADVYITIGIILLLTSTLKSQCQNPNVKQNPKS